MSDSVKVLLIMAAAAALVAAIVLIPARQPPPASQPGPGAAAPATSSTRNAATAEETFRELDKLLGTASASTSATAAPARPLSAEQQRELDRKVERVMKDWTEKK